MTGGALVDALRRRRMSRWLIAYAAAAWGTAEATGFLVDNYGVSRRWLDVVLFLLLVFFFVTIVLVWYHGERGPQRPGRLERGLLGSLLAIGLLGTFWIAGADASAGAVAELEEAPLIDLGEGSVAVMPFRSEVEDPTLDWLRRGVPELLSTHLAQRADLRVVSGQRVFDLLGRMGATGGDGVPSGAEPRVARMSGARMMVTGSIFGRPGDLTLTAVLADVATGEIRASADARGSDVFALVDEISGALTTRSGLGRGADPELASSASLTTGDIEAFRAYEAGRLSFQRYHYAEAADHFARALDLDETFALARFRRALALYQLGRESEATEEVARARTDLAAAAERDRLFIEAFDGFSRDTAAAIATVRELARKYPDEKDARIIFASLLAQLRGDADPEARRLLTETIALDPGYAPAYNLLAYSYASTGDLVAADSLIGRYVELEPGEPNPLDSRGEILELAGRHEAARGAFREALEIQPDFRPALNHLARSYMIEDDPEGARAALAEFIVSPHPEVRVRARALASDTRLWRGEVDAGLADLQAAEREAAEADRPDLRAWRLRDLVRTRLATGDFAGAREAAEAVRAIEPLDGWWITALYDSLVTAGDVEELVRWKPRVAAQIEGNPLTRDRWPVISRLIELWISYARGEHHEVLSIAADLPEGLRTGVLTSWPVFRSMLELGQGDALLDALRRYREPDLFERGPRFLALQTRWAQYFEGRAFESLGDTAAAVSAYRALVDGMGDGILRFPVLADAPERLASLDREESPR